MLSARATSILFVPTPSNSGAYGRGACSSGAKKPYLNAIQAQFVTPFQGGTR